MASGVRLLSPLLLLATLAVANAGDGGEGRVEQCTTLSAKRGEASPTLPMTHPRLKETDRPVEQVHITATDTVIINFLTKAPQDSVVEFRPASCSEQDPLGRVQLDDICNGKDDGKKVEEGEEKYEGSWKQAEGTAEQYSSLNYYTPMDAQGHPLFDKAWWGKWAEPKDWYTSGYCHAVALPDLKPGALYSYRIPPMPDTLFFFRAPKAVDGDAPTRIAVIGDMGQTQNSLQTMDNVWQQLKGPFALDQVLLLGDLSYADGYGPRWDSYGRMVEPLFSHVPAAVIGGNHEFDLGEAWVGIRTRWPMPASKGKDGSGRVTSPMFYSYETGPVHILALCSYMDSSIGSPLYRFVDADLKAVDRTKTPWLVVMMHVPWYTSNSNHRMNEGAMMRASLEPLFIDAKVDLVVTGHVHAYERTFHVGNGGRMDQCDGGIMHITIGDGGNREGLALPWLDPQPDWSALREASYGYGILQIDSATKARWEWWRNDGTNWQPAENVVLERGQCDEEEAEVDVEVKLEVDVVV